MNVHPGTLVHDMAFDELSGIRICFVNMPLRESAKPNTPPQGPALMASRLRQYGAEPSIIDLNAYRIIDEESQERKLKQGRLIREDEVEKLMLSHFNKHGEPDVIGLSGMITTLRWQKMVAKIIRKIVPSAFLITGGGLATEVRSGLFDWIPELNAIVHSEGDDIILVLCRDVKKHKDSGKIPSDSSFSSGNRYHIGSIGGRESFVYGGARPLDLDILPFAAWDLLEEDVLGNPLLEWYIATPVWGAIANNSSATSFTMKRSLTTVSSRGCPYSCRFCFRGAQGERNYGMRSPENLKMEIEWLKKTYNIDFLGFPDDNFAVSHKRIQALPSAFDGLGLRWGTHTRLDEADERAELMARSGCIYIGFGAESANAKVLEHMGKGGFILRPKNSKTNQMVKVGDFEFPLTMMNGIRKCREVGIHANCTWIMGYPTETLNDLQTSVAFMRWQIEEVTKGIPFGTPAYELARSSINEKMFVATAYPGTEMCRNERVMTQLHENFGLNFRNNPRGEMEIVVDQDLHDYILELDDATKVLHAKDGRPLYYGDMPMDQFLEARHLVDSDQTQKILEMR